MVAMNWRRTASYNSQHRLEAGNEKDRDSEWEDEDDSPSSYGSRVTSGSSQPMLSHATSAYSKRPRPLFLSRLPMSMSRLLGLILSALMFLFIYSLFRASWSSARNIQVELEKGGPVVIKPAPWESFPFMQRYYGGLKSLVNKDVNVPEYPGDGFDVDLDIFKVNTSGTTKRDEAQKQRSSKPFDPYPAYKSEGYITEYGQKVDCFLDEAGKVQVPAVHMYEGIPRGMPDAVMGSATLLGLRDDICYDRLGRLGPYGLGYSLARGGSGASMNGDREGADDVWSVTPEVDWHNVKWAEVQERCAVANQHRFEPLPPPKIDRLRAMQVGSGPKLAKREDPDTEPASKPSEPEKPAEPKTPAEPENLAAPKTPAEPKKPAEPEKPAEKPVEKPAAVKAPVAGKHKLPRTALVIRTWWDFRYTPESILYLRSLISELTLHTGGEYQVHFLIHVKDDNIPIWSDDETYERVLRESLPEEFQGMGTLWTERQMLLMYGGLQETMMRGLPVHGVYRSTFMPMQYFAYQHQEYDYFWHWEMDARYTGHYYHLFDSVSKWAKAQPRKHLWERNSRFYIPTEHGSWDDFRHMVRVQTEMGTDSPNNLWAGLKPGSEPTKPNQQKGERPIWGPEPPLDDDVSWDLDVQPPTTYEKDKYEWGVGEEADLITFNPLFDPDSTTWLLAEDVTGYNTTRALPPRRVAIITAGRLSKRLLLTMHHETSIQHHTMFSEMWPASCALQHGLKAVYAPQPEYIDRRWPTNYMAQVFNGGKNGATGGARTSVFGEREHNFRGTTWYYNAGFPEVLWHRWLGYRFNNDGGEEWEVSGEGRMCLPGMLLHPIKRVELIQEGRKVEDWGGGGLRE